MRKLQAATLPRRTEKWRATSPELALTLGDEPHDAMYLMSSNESEVRTCTLRTCKCENMYVWEHVYVSVFNEHVCVSVCNAHLVTDRSMQCISRIQTPKRLCISRVQTNLWQCILWSQKAMYLMSSNESHEFKRICAGVRDQCGKYYIYACMCAYCLI